MSDLPDGNRVGFLRERVPGPEDLENGMRGVELSGRFRFRFGLRDRRIGAMLQEQLFDFLTCAVGAVLEFQLADGAVVRGVLVEHLEHLLALDFWLAPAVNVGELSAFGHPAVGGPAMFVDSVHRALAAFEKVFHGADVPVHGCDLEGSHAVPFRCRVGGQACFHECPDDFGVAVVSGPEDCAGAEGLAGVVSIASLQQKFQSVFVPVSGGPGQGPSVDVEGGEDITGIEVVD